MWASRPLLCYDSNRYVEDIWKGRVQNRLFSNSNSDRLHKSIVNITVQRLSLLDVYYRQKNRPKYTYISQFSLNTERKSKNQEFSFALQHTNVIQISTRSWSEQSAGPLGKQRNRTSL